MQIISTYGVELRKQNIPIRQTLEIYRSAVSYLIGIYMPGTRHRKPSAAPHGNRAAALPPVCPPA